jgi:hypothetical protein
MAGTRRAGKFTVLNTPVTVSGRRYIQHGVLRTALLIPISCAFLIGSACHHNNWKNWFRDGRGKQKGQ